VQVTFHGVGGQEIWPDKTTLKLYYTKLNTLYVYWIPEHKRQRALCQAMSGGSLKIDFYLFIL
jgi:hypothetical protein